MNQLTTVSMVSWLESLDKIMISKDGNLSVLNSHPCKIFPICALGSWVREKFDHGGHYSWELRWESYDAHYTLVRFINKPRPEISSLIQLVKGSDFLELAERIPPPHYKELLESDGEFLIIQKLS